MCTKIKEIIFEFVFSSVGHIQDKGTCCSRPHHICTTSTPPSLKRIWHLGKNRELPPILHPNRLDCLRLSLNHRLSNSINYSIKISTALIHILIRENICPTSINYRTTLRCLNPSETGQCENFHHYNVHCNINIK